MKTLQAVTLGCSKNKVDTEHILSQVTDSYTILPEDYDGPCDVLILNTCGFIGDAKEESIQAILAAVERKKAGLAGRIIVFGCLSQRYFSQLPDLIPEVDSWLGARDINPVVSALGCRPVPSPSRFIAESLPYAYLKISEGCDRRCSYCAIPFIRGAHKSVSIEDLVEEASQLAARGVRELILIAQDTTFYGLDLYHRRALAELIRELSRIDGIRWIRIHYSYPAGFPDDVLDEMADNPKVCKYLDIPLQHISDKVLDKMHRQVDGAWTRELVRRLRERVPGVSLRTTMIVGHPGEGKKEFAELLDFVREARFERLGAFTYSQEEGTFGAENYRDRIPAAEKQRRLSELMELQREISLESNRARVGSEETVLVDSFTDGILVCRSQYDSPEVDGEILVRYSPEAFGGLAPEDLCGSFIRVAVTAAEDYDLLAEYIGPETDDFKTDQTNHRL